MEQHPKEQAQAPETAKTDPGNSGGSETSGSSEALESFREALNALPDIGKDRHVIKGGRPADE